MFGSGGRGGLRDVVLLLPPLEVIGGELEPGVHGGDVPNVQRDAARADSLGDALQLLAVLGLDVGPEGGPGGVAEERPGLAGVAFEK